MTLYADTSALVAVVFDEPGSQSARHTFGDAKQQVIVSDLACLEFAAVVSRAVRTGRLDQQGAVVALEGFDEFRAASVPLHHGRADFDLAERLVRNFATNLSAPDASHLASAENAGASLVTFAARLAKAANLRGVATPLANGETP